VHKTFNINDLERTTIVGVGLLGGSVGLACRAAGFNGTLVGVGRRESSLRKARECYAVDTVTRDPAAGVKGAGLVILASPIGQFEPLLARIAPALADGARVTDVASTKLHVVSLCERLLPPTARYVGSHPMAGS
jgi:prephenate dehydrogenase